MAGRTNEPVSRPVTAADAEWIVALHAAPHARAFLPQPDVADVVASIGRSDRIERIVADGDRCLALWRVVQDESWLAEIRTIVVAEPGRGVGSIALRAALRWAFAERRVHRVCLSVTAANARARRLYERHGFRLEGTWRDGFRNRDGGFEDLCCYAVLEDDAAPATGADGDV
jgi:ribosomal protein S18 acetylase RimI-like enzyme